MPERKILIAGAGIGGLTAALTLHAGGHDVVVAEASPEPRALGVGINILPHAVAVLARFGLLPELVAAGVETEALVFANRHGQVIHRDARGVSAGAGHPQISIHRGRLMRILHAAAVARLGPERLLYGHRLDGFREHGGRAIAELGTADGVRTLETDLLVAADGIHSTVRRMLHPAEGPPRWNGVMMWRGTTRAKPFLGGRTMVQAGTGDAKFVVYPLDAAPDADGCVLINWIADIRRKPRIDGTYPAPERQDWMKAGRVEDLLAVFGRWRFEWLDVPEIIRAAEQILEWPMVDRDPLPGWSKGPVTLLGDAAHPMYPIGSNGASQAILDAAAMAEALESANLNGALARYEADRLPMTRDIVAMNRRQGIDAILDLVEARAPDGFSRIEDIMDPAEIAASIDGYKAAAGHQSGGRPADGALR